jgi:hypothetical protein
VLALAANYLLNGVPTASNGKPLYYSYSYAYPGNPVSPADWPHNPAGLYAMLTDSGLAFYAYSGNVAMTDLVRDVLTHHLDHGMTPSTWHWPGVAYASGDAGSLTYQGAVRGNAEGIGDGVGVIEPDKVAEIGLAFLKYYEFSGTVRFRDAALQAADVLASHVRIGNATQSPWPFRVYAETNAIRHQYTAQVISPIKLFDELLRLNLGNVSAYQAARQTAWNWLMTYPIQNNVWVNYFEDTGGNDLSNLNQLSAGETARYLMRHPEFDPNWETHVRGIIAWIESRFGVPQFGANTIAEQLVFYHPMGSHTSRYASLTAQLYELTGDQAAREKALRAFNWATYMCGSNGVVIDGPEVNNVWWTDGYGDYIKHFLGGVGSVPEWAPQSQTHLLRSTSVVRSIQYAPGEINYQLFDGSAQEVLRLNFVPQSVTADGIVLPNRGDLAQEGWTFDSATGVMRVRHNSGTQLRISNAPANDNNIPPTVSLDSPASGNYVTPVSLTLTATATDQDGTIARVEFLKDGTNLATAFTPPYEFTWGSVPPGSYQLTAMAVDDQGGRTTSSAVSVVVTSPPPSPPPTNLVAMVSNDTINLTWSAPVGGPAVANYRIYRSTTSGFTPGAGNLIGQSVTLTFSDALPAGTYYYLVVAVDDNGNPSLASNEASATIAGRLKADNVIFSDGLGTRTTPAFSTSAAGALLIAFAASDGTSSGGQTLTISGAGLTWTLVRRMNTQRGSSEIWKAVAPSVLTNAAVTSTPGRSGFNQSLTVVVFSGASGTGASAAASGISAPTVSLTTTRPGSLVYGVGNDWDRAVARTVGANQAIVHQWVDVNGRETLWVQNRTAPLGAAGTVVQVNDTAPTNDRWNLAAVEIVAVAPGASVSVPNVVNLTQTAATTAITNAGLVVGTVSNTSSSTVPAGSVISQTPTATTQVAPGSAVDLTVSTGPPPVQVPNVFNVTQAAATTAITNAGLVVGTVTSDSSSTVPAGSVISQTPPAGTSVAPGSAVNLVVSTGPPSGSGPAVDTVVFSDGAGTRTTAPFSTTVAGDVLVAFVSSDGPGSGPQTATVSGAGLTWALVRRGNTRAGTSEIWQARATGQLTNVTVQSVQSVSGFRQSLTVVAFRGASGVGTSVAANGATGAPSVTLVTTRSNALVYGVGNDWDRAVARTLGANQTMVHQVVDTAVGDTFWVQNRNGTLSAAGTSVQLNDTAPTTDRWNFVGVEIVP